MPCIHAVCSCMICDVNTPTYSAGQLDAVQRFAFLVSWALAMQYAVFLFAMSGQHLVCHTDNQLYILQDQFCSCYVLFGRTWNQARAELKAQMITVIEEHLTNIRAGIALEHSKMPATAQVQPPQMVTGVSACLVLLVLGSNQHCGVGKWLSSTGGCLVGIKQSVLHFSSATPGRLCKDAKTPMARLLCHRRFISVFVSACS